MSACVGSILFALFLVGWGLAFIWGPIADRFGRARVLAASVLVYAVFTGAAALSQNVWQLGLFRLLAGIGIGGEWALAGTYVAEAWPEDRRKMGAGYLQTGYYAGFFLAAALNFTVGAHFRLARHVPVRAGAGASLAVHRVQGEGTGALGKNAIAAATNAASPLAQIFGRAISAPHHRQHGPVDRGDHRSVGRRGLRADGRDHPGDETGDGRAGCGAHGLDWRRVCCRSAPSSAAWWCRALAERIGRRKTLALYFTGMACCIWLSFGWAFYLADGLAPFIAVLFFLGFFGGNFAMFSLWLPEQYGTAVRATAFAFATSFGRFIGAGVNFLLGSMIHSYGSLGIPVATTALAFMVGLLIIPFAMETKGLRLPE